MTHSPSQNDIGRQLNEGTVYPVPLPVFIQTLSKTDAFHWQKVALSSLYGTPLPLSDPRGQMAELSSFAKGEQLDELGVFIEKATQLHAYSARSSDARISYSWRAGEEEVWDIVDLTPEQRTAYLASLRAILQRRETRYSTLYTVDILISLARTAELSGGDPNATQELRRWRAVCARLSKTHPDVMAHSLLGAPVPEGRSHPKGVYSVFEDLAYSGVLHDTATERLREQTKDEVGAALYEKYVMDWLNGCASAAYGVALLAQTAIGELAVTRP